MMTHATGFQLRHRDFHVRSKLWPKKKKKLIFESKRIDNIIITFESYRQVQPVINEIFFVSFERKSTLSHVKFSASERID